MRTIAAVCAFGAVIGLTSLGHAETIRGQVRDRATGSTVEGAVVHVRAPDGAESTVNTDAHGRYKVVVPPGKYRLTFLHGKGSTAGTIIVGAGADTVFDARLLEAGAEIIVVESRAKPAVAPEPIGDSTLRTKVPPYSDTAILQDAWTRAWLLLDVDETGKVTQLKFLKKPGYDLEDIAMAEAWKLQFEPALNERGHAIPSFVLWPIEWPSKEYLMFHNNQQLTRMPQQKGLGVSRVAWVPCKGSGPWRYNTLIGSYKGYRDCSRPDMDKVQTEPWILRPD